MAQVSSRPARQQSPATDRPYRAPARRPVARWIIALGLALLVHALGGIWLDRAPALNRSSKPIQVPVQVTLLTPRPIELATRHARSAAASGAPGGMARTRSRHGALQAVAPSAPQQGANPVVRADTQHKRSPPVHVPADPTANGLAAREIPAGLQNKAGAGNPAPTESTAAQVSGAADAAASDSSTAFGASTASDTATASGATSNTAASSDAHGSGEKFALPPSAQIRYDTFYNGVQNQAGTLQWTTDGTHYQMIVSMSLPFVGTYSFTSEGRIDAFGLAPQRYVEQRGRRGADTTRFERDTQPATISFSRSPQSVPLTHGAQDRFSMMMQLASLVRGNPAAYRPGVTRQFFVADSDSGEIWPIEMIGTEPVQTRQGFVEALHFMRLPRRDGDRRRIDMWLAPALGYLPVRLVQTEPNGTQVELLWHGRLPASSMPTRPDTRIPKESAAASGKPAAREPPVRDMPGAPGMDDARMSPEHRQANY